MAGSIVYCNVDMNLNDLMSVKLRSTSVLFLSTEGSLVITRAYPAYILVGPPVERPVLAP